MRVARQVLVTALLLLPQPSGALILQVRANGTGDYPTIQAAIDAAAPGDSVLCLPGIYTGTGNRDIQLRGLAIAVIGQAGPSSTILDCQGQGRGFFVHEGETPSTLIQGFTIRNGFNSVNGSAAGGGIRVFTASPTLRDLDVIDCESRSFGGGIYLYQSEAVLEDLVMRGNFADNHGGGLCLRQSNATLAWALIEGNDTDPVGYGGGIDLDVSTLSASHVSAAGNRADIACGIYVGSETTLALSLSVIAWNTGDGGGIYTQPSGTADLSCCDVFANAGGNFAGAMTDPTGTGGNISLDPWFCDLDAGDLELDADSPCLADNNDCHELMGSLGEGCDLIQRGIAGTIRDEFAIPLEGVAINGVTGLTIFTNASGQYYVDVIDGWSGTLTPSHPVYSFAPPSRSYANVHSDFLDQDYNGYHSVVHHVPADYSTIQAAVNACLAGDTVLVAPGTYEGSGNHDIELPGFDVVILSEGGSALTILNCDNQGRGFYVHRGETVATLIQGFTILDGRVDSGGTAAGGAIRVAGAAPTLRDLRMSSCISWTWGGGLYFYQSTGSIVEDVVIESCLAKQLGGGLAISESSVRLERLQVLENNADQNGGAAYCLNSSPEFVSSSFIHNYCSGTGGGLVLEGGATTITECLIAFSSAFGTWSGGGILGSNDQTALNITCSDVWGNCGGAYAGSLSDQTGINGNIAEDPRCCDLGTGDWSLHASSPCLPAGNTCGVQMGTLGEGCAAPLHRVAGTVADAGGAGVSGVRFVGLAVPLYTGPAGQYSCYLPGGWSGTLTPSSSAPTIHFLYEPTSRSYSSLGEDLLDEDYLAWHSTEVHVPADIPDLRTAMNYALNGDTITVAPGTYPGGVFFMGKAVLLRSSGGPGLTLIDCMEMGFVFENGEDETSVAEGFTFLNGWQAQGSAVEVKAGSSPVLRNLIFRDNSGWPCLGWGGPLSIDGASAPKVKDCIFRDNSCLEGGGVWIGGGSTPLFEDCLFEDNEGSYGGAAHIEGGATPRFERAIFRRNIAHSWDQGDPPGGAQGLGGAVYCRDSNPVFNECLFSANSAEEGWYPPPGRGHAGGAVYSRNAFPAFTRCTFHGNGSSDLNGELTGGTFFVTEASVPVLDEVIVTATVNGGGFLRADSGGVSALNCCDVFGNAGGDFVNMDNPTGTDGNISADPVFCDAAAGDFTLATYSPCLPDNNECGVQIGAFAWGCEGELTSADPALPATFMLSQNHPNPFNPRTTIRFGLPRQAKLDLCIYDISGRVLCRPYEGASLPAGWHEVVWDGRDDSGRPQASGVYFYRLQTSGFCETRKMLLLR